MARILKTNLAASTLAAGITDSALAFTVATGEGALFPDPGTGEQVKLRIGDEIVLCDSRTGDAFTVNASGRGHESTTAAAHSAGDAVTEVATAEDYIEKVIGYPRGETRLSLFNVPASPHADDDEFVDGTITGWTEVDVTGTTGWTEDAGVLSCIYDGQSSADINAMVKAMTPSSPPVTIQTAVTALAIVEANSMQGLVFTDGTSSTSNAIALMLHQGSSTRVVSVWGGTLTNMTAKPIEQSIGLLPSTLYMRLIWVSANTWFFQVSPTGADGSWTSLEQSTAARTFTPTHFGFFVSKWGGAMQSVVSFEHFRVVEADTSS